jgi:hypothetical protein
MTTKSKPKYRYQLRVLAGKLETGSLPQSERAGLARLLRGLGEGFSVSEIFNEPTEPHRPASMALEQRIFDVAVLMRPKKHGGEGLTKAMAIEQVAKLFQVTVNTIEDDYKSARGKKIRELVKTNYYNPLE